MSCEDLDNEDLTTSHLRLRVKTGELDESSEICEPGKFGESGKLCGPGKFFESGESVSIVKILTMRISPHRT